MSEGSSPLSIVGYKDDQDLRYVTWNQNFLTYVATDAHLKHREAIVYCNVAKNRVRIVAVFYGLPVLILPPIDPSDRISLYLKINEFLRKFSGTKKATEFFDTEISSAKERLEQLQERQALAHQAQQKRSKKR